MNYQEIIRELIEDAEQDRTRIERREQTLRALLSALGGSGNGESPATSELSTEIVVIVAAQTAYAFYHRHAAYVCQPYRRFNRSGITHLGFYSNTKIWPEIPLIEDRRQAVGWTYENAERLRATGDDADAKLANVIEGSLRSHERNEGDEHDVFLLTPADDTSGTLTLPQPIEHYTSRHNWSAWTRKHRYVLLEALRTLPETTDDLEAAQHEIELRLRLP